MCVSVCERECACVCVCVCVCACVYVCGRPASVSRRVHVGVCRQVDAEEAGIGRGGIADAGRCTNAAAKTLQSLSSCSHIHRHQQHHHHHTGRRVHDSPLSLSLSLSSARRVHVTRQQRSSRSIQFGFIYLRRATWDFVTAIHLVFTLSRTDHSGFRSGGCNVNLNAT